MCTGESSFTDDRCRNERADARTRSLVDRPDTALLGWASRTCFMDHSHGYLMLSSVCRLCLVGCGNSLCIHLHPDARAKCYPPPICNGLVASIARHGRQRMRHALAPLAIGSLSRGSERARGGDDQRDPGPREFSLLLGDARPPFAWDRRLRLARASARMPPPAAGLLPWRAPLSATRSLGAPHRESRHSGPMTQNVALTFLPVVSRLRDGFTRRSGWCAVMFALQAAVIRGDSHRGTPCGPHVGFASS